MTVPAIHTLSTACVELKEYFHIIWLHLLPSASLNGISMIGRIDIDSTKFHPDCSEDLVIEAKDYDALVARLQEHIDRAAKADADENIEGQSIKTPT